MTGERRGANRPGEPGEPGESGEPGEPGYHPQPHECALSRSWMMAIRNRNGERTNVLILVAGLSIAAVFWMTALIVLLTFVMPPALALPAGTGAGSAVGLAVWSLLRRQRHRRQHAAFAERVQDQDQRRRASRRARRASRFNRYPSRRVGELRGDAEQH